MVCVCVAVTSSYMSWRWDRPTPTVRKTTSGTKQAQMMDYEDMITLSVAVGVCGEHTDVWSNGSERENKPAANNIDEIGRWGQHGRLIPRGMRLRESWLLCCVAAGRKHKQWS